MTTNVVPKTAENVVEPTKPKILIKKRREWPLRTFVSLLLLAAFIFSLNPVIGTYYNNWHAAQYAKGAVLDNKSNQVTNAAELKRAQDYNKRLGKGKVLDPWGGGNAAFKKSGQKAWNDYMGQLNATQAMARLRVPSIDVSMGIYHGTGEDALHRGAGHMYGTSLPVGGTGTHVGIAAHRGLPDFSGFDNLPKMKLGDVFYIDVVGETLEYKVDNIKVVLPDNLDTFTRVGNEDKVTLITCTPYAINTHRLLVTGHRVPYVANEDHTKDKFHFDWSIKPWMYKFFLCALILILVWLGLIIFWIHEDRKYKKRKVKAQAKYDALLEEFQKVSKGEEILEGYTHVASDNEVSTLHENDNTV